MKTPTPDSAEAVNVRICTGCLKAKPVTEFYPDNRNAGRYRPRCKACESDYQKTKSPEQFKMETRRWRDKNPETARASGRKQRAKRVDKYIPDPLKAKARRIVRTELEAGRIIRPQNCSRCQDKCRPQAHHSDYTKPTDVVWLCVKCHGLETRIENDAAQRAAAFLTTKTRTN